MKLAKQMPARKLVPANRKQLRAFIYERFGLIVKPNMPCNVTGKVLVNNPHWKGTK